MVVVILGLNLVLILLLVSSVVLLVLLTTMDYVNVLAMVLIAILFTVV